MPALIALLLFDLYLCKGGKFFTLGKPNPAARHFRCFILPQQAAFGVYIVNPLNFYCGVAASSSASTFGGKGLRFLIRFCRMATGQPSIFLPIRFLKNHINLKICII
ncbi:hypothetical protein [Neisseria dumasiana]|uniref:hypothetical protein n=1 Tax=Neisseria dumasiana TaxID=1931275 RepID=UPI000F785596|nr:hypothetical protein [Neisseria dumasiana]